jgi:TatA/E family protein of Tat protein translocase
MTSFCGLIGPIGWPELLVILALVLIVFGPRRLPEIAESFGKSIRKFRSATKEATDEVKRELDSVSQEPPEEPPANSGTDASADTPEQSEDR